MAEEPPTPPASLPPETIETLNGYEPERLRDVAEYADQLAEHKEQVGRREEREEDNGTEQPEELPEGVPSKATITVKEINDNRYYYWQWREGDTVKSKYKGPVVPEE
jgi:hypothetical protein